MTTSTEPAGPTARIGISGWRYKPWRGTFYPPGLVQHRELEYAAGHLDTIEINGSFYSLQRPSSYLQWRDATPPDFVFAVKGGRYITHMLRLRNVQVALANFFASGVLALDAKLGPILWQLPERVTFDAEVLDQFLALLPRSTTAAAGLATGRDDKLGDDRVWTDVVVDRPLRHALEIRHPSYINPEFYDLLRRHNVALVVADSAGRWPMLHEVTADFVYVRLHGGEELYVSGYSDDELDCWADTVKGWLTGSGCPDGRGRDVHVYFDNDVKVHAPFNAMGLARRLGRQSD
ncbi:DUF72 domain-containing protein [Arthrobacter sp. H14]|uniref:DUF72 domain-containing protein n=1 Tax=Arthrobacter sp. H14 TaxID=1312959 RepID=UPI0004BBDF66|nr:DUF72 domain-containing protein [Arthrobacter sp. H14]